MLIIFDCDGVLVDSEQLAAKVFSDTLADYQFCLSADECLSRFKGWTLEACYQWLVPQFGGALPDGFDEAIKANTREVFARELKAVNDVESVLQQLQKRNRSFCVASNGGLKKIDNSLSVCGLAQYFPVPVRFSAEQVSQGKPSPELFLKAAEAIGVPPRFCWVVEDSLAGCQAAKAAAMNLVFFNETAEPTPQAVVDLRPVKVVHSMLELRSFFESKPAAFYTERQLEGELINIDAQES
ncbi:HAD family hydrolase [Agaribacterium sp. ZY112]|uniref:HAD family hydrolase n=1 Tax=Agaribacterium sp. ZY112 TaxID=3233574 RepID=UPI0035233535